MTVYFTLINMKMTGIKALLLLAVLHFNIFTAEAETIRNEECRECHPDIYKQWSKSSHSRSATDTLFLNMYNGTEAFGFKGWRPGYKLDFPHTAGNCAACHDPLSAEAAPLTTDINTVEKSENISCVFCHSVKGIELHPGGKMPGILSFKLKKEKGSCPNSAPSLLRKSEFCAPCHIARFWDVPIFNTYMEWRESPYYKQGIQCQDCHMPDANHEVKGSADRDFLSSAVELELEGKIDEVVEVLVRVKNKGAGHLFPTGHPMRNLILVIEARDDSGSHVNYLGREKVPAYGGTYRGKPGKGFAMLLGEVYHELCFNPSAKNTPARIGQNISRVKEEKKLYAQPFWRHTYVEQDTRIQPSATDTSTYQFEIPDAQHVTIQASLIYRRAFEPLARYKGWELKDIPVGEESLKLFLY